MVNYNNAKIYKIVCNKTGLVYIGSTCKKLCQRLSAHRTSYKRFLNGKSTKKILSFKVLENNDYDIVLIELCPCNTKEELHKKERNYIETLECVNKIHLGRSSAQHYQDNKVRICARVKAF